jgi:hypothetical protein
MGRKPEKLSPHALTAGEQVVDMNQRLVAGIGILS